jgi:hypothetical protein
MTFPIIFPTKKDRRVIIKMNLSSLEYGKYCLTWIIISDKMVTMIKKVKNTDRRKIHLFDMSG